MDSAPFALALVQFGLQIIFKGNDFMQKLFQARPIKQSQ